MLANLGDFGRILLFCGVAILFTIVIGIAAAINVRLSDDLMPLLAVAVGSLLLLAWLFDVIIGWDGRHFD